MARLEEVFLLSGVPTFTFVEPLRYNAIRVSFRTPGRCLVMEGPSGIGKTTVINKIAEEAEKRREILQLSARNGADLEIIEALPDMGAIGTVIIDDFHRLNEGAKAKLSDFMKTLADSGDESSKLILIGINKAGDQLVKFAHDLGMRIDIFKMEANPPEKIEELIEKGEGALRVSIRDKRRIAERSQGSFHIAQALCHNLCLEENVTEACSEMKEIDTSVDVVAERMMVDLSRQFREPCITFARGSKIRREGRAPYLHILKWLSEGDDWSLDLKDALRTHPEHRASVGQVLEKGFLKALLEEKENILGAHFHFNEKADVLSVEDPKLIFFLKNIVWREFTKAVGFSSEFFSGEYDFALSFAGPDRAEARRIFDLLTEREVSVFYDENEQHRIIAKDIEDYLGPIYRSEANYVIPLLSEHYPMRIWTRFESRQFQNRFGDNAVIPIRYRSVRPGYFSEEQKYGSLSFDPNADRDQQLREIVDILCKRLEEDRGIVTVRGA